jgi:hypothetical protein
MSVGIDDGIFTNALALALCAAVLVLFASSIASVASVDVPVVSSWIHQDEVRDSREVVQKRGQEEERDREAAAGILESRR